MVEDQFEFAGKFHTGVWIRATEPLLPPQAICRMEREEFFISETVVEVEEVELEGGGAARKAEPLQLENDEVATPEIIVPDPFNSTFQNFKAFLAYSEPPKKKDVQKFYKAFHDRET